MTPQATVRVQLRARVLPLLTGLLLLLQLLAPHRSWTVLLVGLGGAWLLAHRWAHALANGLTLTREQRLGWVQVGDVLQERFTLTNRGWAPALWVAVRDHATLPGYQVGRVQAVGERALVHWFTRGTCRRRGLFTLGPTSLESGDPFGFYRVTITYPGVSTMMVLPPTLSLPSVEVAPAARAGDGRRPAASALDHAVNAAGVREYAPGDSLRWVHWPTSARRNALFVRLFDPTPAGDWWILLDVNRRAQAGEGLDATEEQAIILAASLAAAGLTQGTAVGLAAAAHRQPVWLPPQVGEGQQWQILRALALLVPGDRPLAHLLAAAGASLRGPSSLVLITPDVSGAWLPGLARLMRRGAVPTVLLLDRPAFGGPGSADRSLAALQSMGVAHKLVTPDLLDRPERQPGRLGQWRRTGRGHWEPRFDPAALDWRRLA